MSETIAVTVAEIISALHSTPLTRDDLHQITRAINAVAARKRRAVCHRGHPMTGDDANFFERTVGGKVFKECRTCHSERELHRDKRASAGLPPKPIPKAPPCVCGHGKKSHDHGDECYFAVRGELVCECTKFEAGK